MADINSVNMTGTVTRDPELRQTPGGGKSVLDLDIACNRGWGDNQKTYYFRLVFWEKSAEAAAKQLIKGSRIAFQGELTQEKYEAKETKEKKSSTRIVVRDWTFAGGKRPEKPTDDREEQGGTEKAAEPPRREPGGSTGAPGADDDDIPF